MNGPNRIWIFILATTGATLLSVSGQSQDHLSALAGIELIQQRNDAPSGYLDFLETSGEGLQHVAYWTEDFDGECERANSLGWEVLHSGQVGGSDGRFMYFETRGHPGTVLEVSEVSGSKGRFFERIRQISADWDGSEPIRPVG